VFFRQTHSPSNRSPSLFFRSFFLSLIFLPSSNWLHFLYADYDKNKVVADKKNNTERQANGVSKLQTRLKKQEEKKHRIKKGRQNQNNNKKKQYGVTSDRYNTSDTKQKRAQRQGASEAKTPFLYVCPDVSISMPPALGGQTCLPGRRRHHWRRPRCPWHPCP